MPLYAPAALAAAVVALEGRAARRRFRSREELFAAAEARARATGRTLVVVGDPHAGLHTRIVAAYPCGDVCVDLTGCPACPVGVAADLTHDRVERVPDDSAVVFVSCVFEYVTDPDAMWRECARMAGGDPANVFVATVQRDTLTGTLYPGARWSVTGVGDRGVAVEAVSGTRKLVAGALLSGLLIYLFREGK